MQRAACSFVLLIAMTAVPSMAFEPTNSDRADRLQIELHEVNETENRYAFETYVAELAASARNDEANSRRAKHETERKDKKAIKPLNPKVLFRW